MISNKRGSRARNRKGKQSKRSPKIEDENEESGIHDGYIGKDHPRKASSSSNEEQNGTVDIVEVNEAKVSTLAAFHTTMENEKHHMQKEIERSMKKMTKHVDQLMEKASLSGSNFLGITEQKKAKPIFSEKVFEIRDSLLFESTKKGKEAHTIFNIFISILILIFAKMIAHDTIKGGHQFIDTTLLIDMMEAIKITVFLWLPSYLFSSSVVVLVHLILTFKLSYVIYLPVYCVILMMTFVYPIYASLALSQGPIAGLILTCEMARFGMKTHAYFREKLLHCTPNPYLHFIPSFAKKRGVTFEDLNMPKITKGSLWRELKLFNYFLWIPTLVYRDEYPRRPKVSKSNLFFNVIAFQLCFYYVFALFKELLIPTFNKYFANEADLEDIITASSISGVLFTVLAFFGVLHSWMNIFAELTRFGDRQFYTDWWNVSNYGAYYRKWNIIVHEWLYYYVYNDSVRLSLGKIGNVGSKSLVFGISAIVHEVIIACSLRFFYPILLIMFGGAGVFLMSINKSDNRFLGIFFWFTFIIGNGMNITLYCLEFYSRQEPEVIQNMQEQGIWAFFIPQSYDYLMKRYS